MKVSILFLLELEASDSQNFPLLMLLKCIRMGNIIFKVKFYLNLECILQTINAFWTLIEDQL